MGRYLPIVADMRRRAGSILPLEISILESAAESRRSGQPEVHGYLLATLVRDLRHARRLTAYGTLYKALTRLERVGYLASRWEDPELAAAEARPRRRFYRLTLHGEAALNDALAQRQEAPAYRPAASTAR